MTVGADTQKVAIQTCASCGMRTLGHPPPGGCRNDPHGLHRHSWQGQWFVPVGAVLSLPEIRELQEAATVLLRLKDGPRDESYRALKANSWGRLRAALAALEDQ